MAQRDEIEVAVRDYYAAAARRVSTCCEPVVGGQAAEVFGASSYDRAELEGLPTEAVAGSIGCANPVALAHLDAGEVVLDLGSGGGIDVLLSARRVGPAGKAYGLDMTDEMLELARANQAKAGVENVEFLRGHMEDIPLPDASVDVVISNCVINLSADKAAVFAEACRVLRPGGRFAVADVVADAETTAQQRGDLSAWVDCIAGALTRDEYRAALRDAHLAEIEISDSHAVGDGFTSVLVRAVKPLTSSET